MPKTQPMIASDATAQRPPRCRLESPSVLACWVRCSLLPRTGRTAIADFVNTELHGVLSGGLNGGILSALEILVLRGAYGASLRRLPFLPYLALRS
jgi:hypothetical protein